MSKFLLYLVYPLPPFKKYFQGRPTLKRDGKKRGAMTPLKVSVYLYHAKTCYRQKLHEKTLGTFILNEDYFFSNQH